MVFHNSTDRKSPHLTISLTVVQCIACAVVLLLALVLRLIGGKPFESIRVLFEQAITDTSVTQTVAVGGTNINTEEPSVKSVPDSVSTEQFVAQEKAALPLAEGKITSLFGHRTDPFTKKLGFHTGVDISAVKGTKIMAVYSGVVVRVDENNGYGKHLVIQHDNGAQTLYAHCSTLCKKVGDVVGAGEVVAKVGSTGNSTGSHLHLELKQDGLYHNPLEIWEEHPYA